MLAVLVKDGAPWGWKTYICPLENAKEENIKWLIRHKCPMGVKLFSQVAVYGSLKVIQLFYQAACPWDVRTTAAAALRGDIEILAWLVEKGCPLGKETMVAAAESYNLDTMKWLYEKGCPLSGLVRAVVTFDPPRRKLQHIVDWLNAIGCPTVDPDVKPFEKRNILKVNVRWIYC